MRSNLLKISGIVFFAIATLWSLFWVFYGLDHRDTFFFLNNALYSTEINPLVPLTLLSIRALSVAFGNYVIVYRIANWACYYFAFLLFIHILKHDDFINKYAIWLSAIVISFIPILNDNVFNGNALTVLLMLLSFACLYRYTTCKNLGLLIALSVLICMAILCRFPNVIIVPILCLFGWLVTSNYKEYLFIVCSSLMSIVFYLIIGGIIYDGIDHFFDTLSNSLTVSSNSGGANHSISTLMSGYLHTLKDIISDIKYISLISIIGIAVVFVNDKLIKLILSLLFAVAHILFIYFRVLNSIQYHYIVYLYANICVLIFVSLAIAIISHDVKLIGWSVLSLLFPMCSASGADSGLLFIGGQLIAFTPFVILIIYQHNNSIDDLNVWLPISLLCLSISTFLYCRNGMIMFGVCFFVLVLIGLWFSPTIKMFKANRLHYEYHNWVAYVPFVLLVLMSMSMTVYYRFSVPLLDEKSYNDLNVSFKNNEFKGIYTCRENYDFINDIMYKYDEIKKSNDNVRFYGNQSHVFCYLTKTGLIDGVDFAMDCDKRNLDILENFISSDSSSSLFVVPTGPTMHLYDFNAYTPLDSMLINNNFICQKNDFYYLYERKN